MGDLEAVLAPIRKRQRRKPPAIYSPFRQGWEDVRTLLEIIDKLGGAKRPMNSEKQW